MLFMGSDKRGHFSRNLTAEVPQIVLGSACRGPPQHVENCWLELCAILCDCGRGQQRRVESLGDSVTYSMLKSCMTWFLWKHWKVGRCFNYIESNFYHQPYEERAPLHSRAQGSIFPRRNGIATFLYNGMRFWVEV